MTTTNNYEYMNESSIHEDLLCPLCTDPLVEPLCANKCGHTFCRVCITNSFYTMSTCPVCRCDLTLEDFHTVNIRPLLNQLNQLLVKCQLCSQNNIQRGNLKDHIEKCSQRQLLCPAANLKCDWTGKQDEVADHVNNCLLMKVRPLINELNAQVKQQSDQIHFLSTILKKISSNHTTACKEIGYGRRGTALCDVCGKKYTLNEDKQRLHFCPQTDICSDCVTKYFP
ncbi:hypothetical protein I4U23_023427 [Adineta vaga]|nr:hypothetical protein I4U23_023427 [Adineta vaga]